MKTTPMKAQTALLSGVLAVLALAYMLLLALTFPELPSAPYSAFEFFLEAPALLMLALSMILAWKAP